jgi:hypothetical protein
MQPPPPPAAYTCLVLAPRARDGMHAYWAVCLVPRPLCRAGCATFASRVCVECAKGELDQLGGLGPIVDCVPPTPPPFGCRRTQIPLSPRSLHSIKATIAAHGRRLRGGWPRWRRCWRDFPPSQTPCVAPAEGAPAGRRRKTINGRHGWLRTRWQGTTAWREPRLLARLHTAVQDAQVC